MNVPAKISGRPATGSAEEWRGIVEDFEREGTTAAAYCEGRRAAPKMPFRRRRRFAREADPAPAFVSLGPAPGRCGRPGSGRSSATATRSPSPSGRPARTERFGAPAPGRAPGASSRGRRIPSRGLPPRHRSRSEACYSAKGRSGKESSRAGRSSSSGEAAPFRWPRPSPEMVQAPLRGSAPPAEKPDRGGPGLRPGPEDPAGGAAFRPRCPDRRQPSGARPAGSAARREELAFSLDEGRGGSRRNRPEPGRRAPAPGCRPSSLPGRRARRISIHPSSRVEEPAPRRWKDLFAGDPTAPDLGTGVRCRASELPGAS